MSTNVPDVLPDDLRQRLNACGQELDAAVDDLQDRQHDAQPPSMLYHYTDGAGLLGILQSGKIRLSDISGMNDPTEIYHGLQFGAVALTEAAAKGHPAARTFAERFDQNIRELLNHAARFYVACFSRAGDDLGQWRAYGANGRGFALGFRGAELEMAFARDQPASNTTISINYDENELRQAATRLASIVLPVIGLPAGRNLSGDALREFIVSLQTRYTEAMLQTALLFKHGAYKNEDEYRFLHVRQAGAPRTGEQVGARGSSLVWFIEFDWKAQGLNLLRQVVTGPALVPKEGRKFVEDCLALTGVPADSVAVEPSGIPYRG